MNKKWILASVAALVIGVVVLNFNINANNNRLSAITLANIEALAQNETIDGTGGICCVLDNETCSYVLITENSGHGVQITNAVRCQF
jgi:hypothetical protein